MRTAHAMICLSKYNNVALYYEKRLWGITVLLMPRGVAAISSVVYAHYLTITGNILLAILYTYLLRPKYKDAADYQGIRSTAGHLFRQARAILAQMPEKLYLSLVAIFIGLPLLSSLPTLLSLLTGDRNWWQLLVLISALVLLNLGFLIIGAMVSAVILKNCLPLPQKVRWRIDRQVIINLLVLKTQLTSDNLEALLEAVEIPELIAGDERLLTLWHGLAQAKLPELTMAELQQLLVRQASDEVELYVITRDFAGFCELTMAVNEPESLQEAYQNYCRSNQKQLYFVYGLLVLATILAIF